MLKIKTKKTKLIAIIGLCFLFTVAGTISGFIFLNNRKEASGVDGSNSDTYSSLSKKYSSKTSSNSLSDKDKTTDDKDNKENDEEKTAENSDAITKNDSSTHDDDSDIDIPKTGKENVVIDQIIVRDIESYEDIPFKIETKTEPNLPRGKVQTIRNGEPGQKIIVTRQTIKNGILTTSEIISRETITEPISQINLLGTSDFNLNNSYIQLYPNAKVSRENHDAPAFMILVNGGYYIDFWYDPITWKGYAPSTALMVSGGTFTYDGNSYTYNIGPLDNSFALSEAFCAEYGLACGRW